MVFGRMEPVSQISSSMPFVLRLLLSLTTLYVSISAQTYGGPSGLPGCGVSFFWENRWEQANWHYRGQQTCFNNELSSASGCPSSTDFTCFCDNLNLINSIRLCFSQACTGSDAGNAINVVNTFCHGNEQHISVSPAFTKEHLRRRPSC